MESVFFVQDFCVKILKLNTDTEKYGKICSKEFCAKKENDIWHGRGFLTATYQGGEEKIWTERRQEKKQKPW